LYLLFAWHFSAHDKLNQEPRQKYIILYWIVGFLSLPWILSSTVTIHSSFYQSHNLHGRGRPLSCDTHHSAAKGDSTLLPLWLTKRQQRIPEAHLETHHGQRQGFTTKPESQAPALGPFINRDETQDPRSNIHISRNNTSQSVLTQPLQFSNASFLPP
jgi:hypothetical protein